MTDLPDNKERQEQFIAIILLNEARGIMSDLSVQPGVMFALIEITEEEYDHCLNYICRVLFSCYRNGELKFIINCTGQQLNGYALIFEHPDPSYSRFCHKIYFFEEFRNQGIGKILIKGLLDESQNITLICNPSLISFYEKSGMKFAGTYKIPEDTVGFKFTKEMYNGLAIMNGTGVSGPAPIFMLNDNDVKKMLSIIGKI